MLSKKYTNYLNLLLTLPISFSMLISPNLSLADTQKLILSPDLEKIIQNNQTNQFNWQYIDFKTNLWKITKKGQKPSYLIGTYHLGLINDTASPQVADLTKKTNQVVFEAPIYWSEQKQAKALETTFPKMIAHQTIESQMGTEKYQKFYNEIKAQPATKEILPIINHLKPWAAIAILASFPEAQFSHKTGVDYLLFKSAQKQGKLLNHLEETADSIGFFAEIPDDIAINFLYTGVEHAEENRLDTLELFNTYKNGDFDKIPSLLEKNSSKKQLPEEQQKWLNNWFIQKLLVQRNQNWLPKMQKYMKKQSTIFVIGSGHLLGEQGLIALLQKQGYTVTPENKVLIYNK